MRMCVQWCEARSWGVAVLSLGCVVLGSGCERGTEDASDVKPVATGEPAMVEEAPTATPKPDRNTTAPQTEPESTTAETKPDADPIATGVDTVPGAPMTGEWITTESGLKYVDLVEGSGEVPTSPAAQVTVHYTGWLTDGTKFDSSVDRGQPAKFFLTGVIRGWTEGVGSMNVGSKRKLMVPAELGYGQQNKQNIPPGSTLVFDVELLDFTDFENLPQGEPLPGVSVAGVEKETTESGLVYYDIVEGDGASPGDTVAMNVVGYLADGSSFIDSGNVGKPVELPLSNLPAGWKEGVSTMNIGGQRKLVIPFELGFGERGQIPTIPPRATLVIDVELVTPPDYATVPAVEDLPGESVVGEVPVTTDSGLTYYVLNEGDGATPSKPDAKVTLHYTGWLVDGTKFDSSVDRGQPIVHPLNGFVQGWIEAVGMMQVGDKWKLIIPSNMGYGERGSPPVIPPGATLVFDMELLDTE